MRQIYSALITNFNHETEIYFQIRVSSIAGERTGMCGCALTPHSKPGFIRRMRFVAALLALSSLYRCSSQAARERVEPRIVEKISPLPVALSNDFEFRKTKLFFLSDKPPKPGQSGARQTTSTLGGKSNSPSQKTATMQDAPITFERQYRMFGAVTHSINVSVSAITSISTGGPNGLPMSQCVWNIARRNCTSTSRRRRFHIEMCAALIRPNSRSLETIILTMAA